MEACRVDKLSMHKISELLRQRFELKLSYRTIAKSLGISISTVADYIARARAAQIGWPLAEEISEQELYNKLFLPIPIAPKKRVVPDWQNVHIELRRKGVTLQLLWREYRAQHPQGVCYSQFCNYYQSYKKTVSPVMRQKHKGGEKVFVDYSGMTLAWCSTASGEFYKAEIFVGSLGASQYTFIEATASQQLPDWLDSHMHMFEYFGGVPEIVVPDNLKSGVTKAHRYDPDINVNYQHFSEHYGIAIVPARAASPKDKAKVENSVFIVERQILAPLRDRVFGSLAEINAELKKGLHILNTQQFQKINTTRAALFTQLDQPNLKPLPPHRYQYATWKKATINVDYHFAFEDCYYSVPYNYIGKKVELRATHKTVECFYDNKRIATHQRSYAKFSFSTEASHMPVSHQEHANFSPQRLHNWAATVGRNTAEFINHMIKSRAFPQQAYRACLGLLRLGKRYGNERLDKACHKALAAGASRYQHVESILKNNLEEAPINNNAINSPLIEHENVRGPEYYQ